MIRVYLFCKQCYHCKPDSFSKKVSSIFPLILLTNSGKYFSIGIGMELEPLEEYMSALSTPLGKCHLPIATLIHDSFWLGLFEDFCESFPVSNYVGHI